MSRPQSHIFAGLDLVAAEPEQPRRCPVPLCTEPMPQGKHALFCADCHFRLPYETTNRLFRLQLTCERAPDEATRQHLREQLHGYVQQAVRALRGGNP